MNNKSQHLPLNTLLLSVVSIFILAVLIVLISQNLAQTSKTAKDLTVEAPSCTGVCIPKSQCEQTRGIQTQMECSQVEEQQINAKPSGILFIFQLRFSREEKVCCI